MAESWDDKYEYLKGACWLHHNQDYFEFLVRTVWRLDEPCRVIDFGCGYGRMGLALMSLLPAGSTYTGIDTSAALLAKGRETFADRPYHATFIQADVRDAPLADGSFDVAFCHAVLMHIAQPERAIGEMVRVTRHGGMVIACEANRNAHNALFHIHETNEQENAPLELFQTLHREIRLQTGVDYNIGVKVPILLHQAGLKNVAARMSDAVRLLLPPVDTEEKAKLHRAICEQGFGPPPPNAEGLKRWKQSLVDRGISPEAADREIAREIARDFRRKGKDYHTVYPGLLTFSYGTVDKSA